ncbi:Uncharacterised protein [Anaerotruncus sp. 2789STDY5834896]|uniref:Uncharacterized protein n=1 Tax=uncultured Anaerotruncus sp. TaxID=905011 RepID=A0A1C6JWE0_9FIRM|nr:Uncharacterised protein [uncultured Anaerotruncus sp.]
MRLGQREQVARGMCARYGVQYAVYCVLCTVHYVLITVGSALCTGRENRACAGGKPAATEGAAGMVAVHRR